MGEPNCDVSWSRMVGAVHKVHQRLHRSTQALAEAAVPYAVVGGQAVAAWVATFDESAIRNTPNVELLVRRDDLRKVEASLHAVGFSSQGSADRLLYADRPAARRREMLRLWIAGEPFSRSQPQITPDVDEIGPIALFSPLRVLALHSLVRMMLTNDTIVDRVLVRDLIDVGLIDSTWPASSRRSWRRDCKNCSTRQTADRRLARPKSKHRQPITPYAYHAPRQPAELPGGSPAFPG